MLFILFSINSYADEQTSSALNYFPIYKGARWTYATSQGNKEIVTVTGYEDLNGIKAVISESSLTGKLYYVLLKDKLYRFKDLKEAKQALSYTEGILVLDTPFDVGAIWSSDLQNIGATYVSVLSVEDVKTETKTFKNTIKIAIREFSSPNYSAIIWLAPEIGIVKTLETEFTKTLISFSPGQKDSSIINEINNEALLSNIDLKAKEPPDPQNINEASQGKRHAKSDRIKNYFTPMNIFTVLGLLILSFFIIILVRLSGLLKTEVESLKVESKRNYAETLLKTGEIGKAKKILEDILEKNPRFADVFNSLGILLLEEGKPDKACENFKKAIDINPNYTKAKINMAKALFLNNNFEEALENTKNLIDKLEGYADLHNLAAEIYIAKNEINKAKFHLEKALKINPEYSKAVLNLNKIEDR